MDCIQHKPETTNVFEPMILNFLTNILRIYVNDARDLSAKEFCTILFDRGKAEKSSKLDSKASAYFKGVNLVEVIKNRFLLGKTEFNLASKYIMELRDTLREENRQSKKIRMKLTVPMHVNVLNRPKKLPPVPPSTPEPLTEEKLESLRTINRLQALSLLEDANKNAPNCSKQRETSSTLAKNSEPAKFYVRKSFPHFKPVKVKHTAASILRECARIANDEEKEVKKLKELAEGGSDPSTVSKLEEEARRLRREEEMRKIQEKHLRSLLAREDAFIAKQSVLNDVKHQAQLVRKEKQELYERLEKWRQEHNREMMEIVEKCREVVQASREAFNSMVDEKRQKAAEIAKESRQLKLELDQHREREIQRKIRLIQEIKTIQALRRLPLKDFDPAESSGLGLLCEMSLTQLKERLLWTKGRMQEEIESRKISIRRERERQKRLIECGERALEKYKSRGRDVSSSGEGENFSVITSPEIQALRKKLEECRATRLQKQGALIGQ
ncbi:hypothetical protein KM043_010728 [Ampulex compressa]|nr:hypothetical protein KM043_010728 [Ampulex compressa]